MDNINLDNINLVHLDFGVESYYSSIDKSQYMICDLSNKYITFEPELDISIIGIHITCDIDYSYLTKDTFAKSIDYKLDISPEEYIEVRLGNLYHYTSLELNGDDQEQYDLVIEGPTLRKIINLITLPSGYDHLVRKIIKNLKIKITYD